MSLVKDTRGRRVIEKDSGLYKSKEFHIIPTQHMPMIFCISCVCHMQQPQALPFGTELNITGGARASMSTAAVIAKHFFPLPAGERMWYTCDHCLTVLRASYLYLFDTFSRFTPGSNPRAPFDFL